MLINTRDLKIKLFLICLWYKSQIKHLTLFKYELRITKNLTGFISAGCRPYPTDDIQLLFPISIMHLYL